MTRTPTRSDAVTLAALLITLCLCAAPTRAQGNILDSITENKAEANQEPRADRQNADNKIENVNSPVRAGSVAFKHTVTNRAERAEFAAIKTAIGGTYWEGWSVYIPSSLTTSSFTIVNQWAAYFTTRDFSPSNNGCGGVGQKISFDSNGLRFDLAYPTSSRDMNCRRFNLTNATEVRDKWVDFVMHAKWTQGNDGFVRLWRRVGGASGTWVLKVEYDGPTWWNDEGEGPYFKMGNYKGEPGWAGSSPSIVYTDEYRLGNANAGPNAVAPGGDGPGSTPPPPGGEAPISRTVSIRAAINGKLVAALEGNRALIAEGSTVGSEDLYLVVGNADDTVSFQSIRTAQYVAVRSSDQRLYADAAAINSAAKFRYEAVAGGANQFALRSVLTNRYVAAEAAGAEPLIANRELARSWEQFTWEENQ